MPFPRVYLRKSANRMKPSDPKTFPEEIVSHIADSASNLAELIHEENPALDVECLKLEIIEILNEKFTCFWEAKLEANEAFRLLRDNPADRKAENHAQSEHGYLQYVARTTKWSAADTRSIISKLRAR